MQTWKNGLNISKVTWCRRNLETDRIRVFCTPLFSPSQYLGIVFSSSQSVISGQCIGSLQMSFGVFAHLWEWYLLNSMVTVWQLVSKYSQVVCCVISAHDVPSRCFYTNVSQSSKGLSSSFWHWSFLSCAYFSLLLIKLLQERKCINVMVEAKEGQQLIVHCT